MTDLQQALAALSHPPSIKQGRKGATSGLSIDETLLLHSIGWEPADVVFGVSWWSIPWGVWQWQTGEIQEASTAFAGAFDEAADQLRQECARSGASGVVGVKVEIQVRSHHIDVALTGTAVRRTSHPAKG